MARRSRKKKQSNPAPLIIGLIVALAVIGSGIFMINKLGNKGDFAAKALPLEVYINNANSLRGGDFTVTGEVTGKPDFDALKGQMITLKAANENGDDHHLVIHVPLEAKGPNLETKHNYEFHVKVIKEGFIEAIAYSTK